ncbi:hypothetical protein NW062_04235 [Mycoplasmopsis cynos]|nr:hypothetical protein NW062_04235 [Mycoplasmopsis cynos]
MEQIKIFKTYKLNESLKKGIEGYSKIKCEKIMLIIKIFDDILFGIVFEKDVNPSVKIYQKAKKITIYILIGFSEFLMKTWWKILLNQTMKLMLKI